jgi:hypothetical protein
LRCIEKNPSKRFQSVNELETALTAKLEVTAAVSVTEGPEPPFPIHLTRWQRSDWLLPPLAVMGLLLFFSLFQQVSFAPRGQVSFERSVLRRIAQEHAQKLGAPVGRGSAMMRPLTMPPICSITPPRDASAADHPALLEPVDGDGKRLDVVTIEEDDGRTQHNHANLQAGNRPLIDQFVDFNLS